MDHSVPRVVFSCINNRFLKVLKIVEKCCPRLSTAFTNWWWRAGQKPPQHWRRAFHFSQQHLDNWMWSLDSASQDNMWGSHWASHRRLRLILISPCGCGRRTAVSSAPSSPARPWGYWAPSGVDQLRQIPMSFLPHNLFPPSLSPPCSCLQSNALLVEDLWGYPHSQAVAWMDWGSTWMPHM